MALNPSDIPDLTESQTGCQGSGTDQTLYLKIDLNVPAGNGQPVAPMTAVFAPDPGQLGSDAVDILLWFHGHKGQLGNINLAGYTAKQYLAVNQFKLREFILSTTKKKFLLVVPTLSDRSDAGLLEQQGQAEAFLQQVLNGVRKHMGAGVKSVGDIILAAHSGGGKIMSKVAAFSGIFDSNCKEVWCDDCTYESNSGAGWVTWAKDPGNAHNRLWVFSTGQLSTPVDATKPEGAANPAAKFWGTGNQAKLIYDFAVKSRSSAVEVRINSLHAPDSSRPDNDHAAGPFTTANFTYGFATEHNQSVGFYFAKLVSSSKTLS